MARDDRYDAKDPHEAERRGLLRQIEEEVAGTAHWLGKDRLAPAVMAAIAQVPRHAFVPRMEEAHAYRNEPLPIGLGRSEEHTSELKSLMRISYAVFCLKHKNITQLYTVTHANTRHRLTN